MEILCETTNKIGIRTSRVGEMLRVFVRDISDAVAVWPLQETKFYWWQVTSGMNCCTRRVSEIQIAK